MTQKANFFAGMKAPLAFAGVVFAATVIASAPLSVVSAFVDAERQGVSYSEATGTIWRGGFSGLAVRGVPLGDVSFRLSPLSLVRLAPSVSFTASGGALAGEGRVTAGAASLKLENVKADIRLGAVAPRGVFGEPAHGVARVDIRRLDFSRAKGCRTADGDLWTDVLDAPAKRFNLPAMPMAGAVACDADGRLAVTLAGANARAGAEVVLRIDKTLAYEIAATARPAGDDVAQALRFFGFEDDNGALIYGSAGVLTGAGS